MHFKKVLYIEFNNESDFKYAEIKQKLQINDLKRFGIRTLLIESYEEITDILLEVEKKLKKNSVFISGSAAEYKEFCDDENYAKSFISQLGSDLIKANYQISSGYGLGVGDYVLNGAISSANENIRSEKQRKNAIKMYPFPQNIANAEERKQRWTEYRNTILDDVGFVIFIFGNKKQGDNIENADGVYEEFQIAKKKGVIPIPIGLTGYMAKIIYEEISKGLDSFFQDEKVKELFLQLAKTNKDDGNQKSIDEIIKTVIEIINKIGG